MADFKTNQGGTQSSSALSAAPCDDSKTPKTGFDEAPLGAGAEFGAPGPGVGNTRAGIR